MCHVIIFYGFLIKSPLCFYYKYTNWKENKEEKQAYGRKKCNGNEITGWNWWQWNRLPASHTEQWNRKRWNRGDKRKSQHWKHICTLFYCSCIWVTIKGGKCRSHLTLLMFCICDRLDGAEFSCWTIISMFCVLRREKKTKFKKTKETGKLCDFSRT